MEEAKKKITKLTGKYIEAIGRRKTSIARVRVFNSGSSRIINGLTADEYFKLKKLVDTAFAPFSTVEAGKVGLSVQVKGGGLAAQAEAVRLGLSRALTKMNPDFRARLKVAGFLKRDPRMVERKKAGLKKARRAPQWQKR